MEYKPENNLDFTIIGHGSFGYVLLENQKDYLIKVFFDCSRPCHNVDTLITKNIENNKILLGLLRKDIGLRMDTIILEKIPKIDDCENISNRALIMENLKNPNLSKLIRSNDEILNCFESQIVEKAINYNLDTISLLHNLGYLHLDIRMENIIPIFNGDELVFKIIDYDFMSKIDSEEAITIALANEFYPPEHKYLARRRICNEKSVENYLKIIKNFWKVIEDEIEDFETIDIFREFEDKMIGKYSKKMYSTVYKENINEIEKLVEGDYYRILENVDYFMYGLAMYIFLSRLKKIKQTNEYDRIIERMIGMIDISYKNRNRGL
jgi:serine/threonine protein kinase